MKNNKLNRNYEINQKYSTRVTIIHLAVDILVQFG
jgi:hypothetical protein